ncbi:MAG: hypothetical protein EA423_12000, partial [Phycisphaerales bacterium]
RRGRGFTLLEVMLAVFALVMITGTIGAALQLVTSSQQRQEQNLGAAELANRLTLIYLDNPNDLPRPTELIPYENRTYRYSQQIVEITLTESEAVQRVRRGTGTQQRSRTAVRLDRMRQVTTTVWLSEESGGGREPGPGVPRQTVIRLYDPLDIRRNPDSADRAFQQRQEELIRGIMDQIGGE